MKKKIAMIVDSSYLLEAPDFLKDYVDIFCLPLGITDKKTNESTWVNDKKISYEFVSKIFNRGELLSTSQPSIGIIEKTFSEVLEKYEKVFVMTLRRAGSKTFDSVTNFCKQHYSTRAVVYDSILWSFFSYMEFKFVYDLIHTDKVTDPKEIEKKLIENNKTIPVLAFGVIKNIVHARNSGRLNLTKSLLLSLAKKQPLFYLSKTESHPSLVGLCKNLIKAGRLSANKYKKSYEKEVPLSIIFHNPSMVEDEMKNVMRGIRLVYPEQQFDVYYMKGCLMLYALAGDQVYYSIYGIKIQDTKYLKKIKI